MTSLRRFNPRPRTAGDRNIGQFPHALRAVSIHARVRRATKAVSKIGQSSDGFNPRPRTAGDGRHQSRWSTTSVFQSTPAYGGRRNLHEGYERRSGQFQSTPAYGGRRTRLLIRPAWICFNPRPRTAGDGTWPFCPPFPRFQSTPAYGGRRTVTTVCSRLRNVSIHARVRRATAARQNAAGTTIYKQTCANRRFEHTCQASYYHNLPVIR